MSAASRSNWLPRYTRRSHFLNCEVALHSLSAMFLPLSNLLASQRDFVLKRLSEMPDLVTAVPEGAFYVFPDVSAHFGKLAPDGTTIGGATDLCLYLLRCDALYDCAAFTQTMA